MKAPALRATQDSFNPVRVPARSSRRPLSLWTRAWETAALVIVVAGGALGIVASLRGRTLAGGRSAKEVEGRGGRAAAATKSGGRHRRQGAARRSAGFRDAIAAAAGVGHARRIVTRCRMCSEATSTAALSTGAAPRACCEPTLYRTLESLAVSPPLGHAAGRVLRCRVVRSPPKPIRGPTRASLTDRRGKRGSGACSRALRHA